MAWVKGALSSIGGSSSPAVSFAALPSAGNAIIVSITSYFSSGSTTTHPSCADNQGNSYTRIDTQVTTDASDNYRHSVFVAENIGSPSGTFTVTVTAGNSSNHSMAIDEYSSVPTSGVVHQHTATTGNSSTPSVTLPATSTANCIIYGSLTHNNGNPSITPDATNLPNQRHENENNSTSEAHNVSDRTVSSTGTYTANWSVGASVHWSVIALAISQDTSGAITGSGGVAIGAPSLNGSGDVLNPPSVVAAGTASFTATNAATLAPGLPAGWAADDIHVLLAARSDNTAMTTLGGWTQISAGNNTAAQRVEVWVRRAVGGDTDPTVTFGSGTVVRGARIIGIRGVPTSVALTDLQISRSDNAASATITFATITPTNGTNLLLALYAYEDDPTAASQITNWTTFTISTSSLGNDMALGYASRVWSPANTATGALTSTASGGTFANSVNTGLILSLPAVPFATTGTGGVTIGPPALAGTGTVHPHGTGAVAIGAPALAGSGTVTAPEITGTGGVAIGAPSLAGTGAFATTGSGGVAIGAPSLSGTGTFATTGTGAVSIGAPSLAGAGVFETTGAGALTLGAPSLAASGDVIGPPGSGAVTIGPPALAGSGVFETTGSGAVTIGAPGLSGSGDFATTGTGSVTIGPPALTGSGAFATTGTGAVSISKPALAGSGTVSDPGTGSGALTIGPPALSASGTFTPAEVTGTGALGIGPPSLAGSGAFATTGDGGVTVGAPALSGSGTFTIATIDGSGAVTIHAPSLAAAGSFETVGAGGIIIGPPSLSGIEIIPDEWGAVTAGVVVVGGVGAGAAPATGMTAGTLPVGGVLVGAV